MPQEDVQILVRARTRPAPVIGQGVLHLRWIKDSRSVQVRKSEDFPANLDVVEDGRSSLTVLVRDES